MMDRSNTAVLSLNNTLKNDAYMYIEAMQMTIVGLMSPNAESAAGKNGKQQHNNTCRDKSTAIIPTGHRYRHIALAKTAQ